MNDASKHFFNIEDDSRGIFRQLADGMSTRVFPGEKAMISVVQMQPNALGKTHHHPEEQWGLLIKGSGVRVLDGERISVKAGDFWQTPGGMPHSFEAGAEGATVFDVFAPIREDYTKPGEGFGN